MFPKKVEIINKRTSKIQNGYIEKYLKEKPLRLSATLNGRAAFKDADFVVIAIPPPIELLRHSHVEEVIDLVLDVNPGQ